MIIVWLIRMCNNLLQAMPDLSLDFDTSTLDSLTSALGFVTYVLPMDTVAAILAITLILVGWRIAISILKTIWDVLPLL